MKLARFVLVTVLLLGSLLGLAAAQDLIGPSDSCYGVTHFPDDPIGDAPSKLIIGVALDPSFAGGLLEIGVRLGDDVEPGFGELGPDGLGFIEAGLNQYGTHELVDLTVTDSEGGFFNIDVSGIGDNGSIEVGGDEPLCDRSVLAPFEVLTTFGPEVVTTQPTIPITTTTEPPATTTTTSAAPEATAAPVTTTAPDESEDGGEFPWTVVLIGGGVTVAAGGLAIARSGKKDCDMEEENVAAAQRRLGLINESLEEALSDMQGHQAEVAANQAELDAYNSAAARGSTTENNVVYYAHGGGRISQAELDIQVEYYEGLLRIASEAKDRDRERVREWHTKFEKAQQELREAEQALAVCLGEAPSGGTG